MPSGAKTPSSPRTFEYRMARSTRCANGPYVRSGIDWSVVRCEALMPVLVSLRYMSSKICLCRPRLCSPLLYRRGEHSLGRHKQIFELMYLSDTSTGINASQRTTDQSIPDRTYGPFAQRVERAIRYSNVRGEEGVLAPEGIH